MFEKFEVFEKFERFERFEGFEKFERFVRFLYFVILRYGLGMPSRRVRDDCKEMHYAKSSVTL